MTHYDNVLAEYYNGNYRVVLLNDGTKIRETEEDEFIPAFAENCDVKITDCCDGGCPYCYEGCTPRGKHAHLFNFKSEIWMDKQGINHTAMEYIPAQKWLEHLHYGTELALNGNDLTHPDLNPHYPVLLHYLRAMGVVTNLTVNQKHFMKHYDVLKRWCNEGLIHGLGVSLVDSSNDKFFELIKTIPNAVLHTIVGVLTLDDIVKIRKVGDLKILILGYKNLGRGVSYLQEENYFELKKEVLIGNLKALLRVSKVISFDNLALEQLGIREVLFGPESGRNWDEFYMGDDGTMTYYIDAVKEEYSKNSCMPAEERFSSKGLTVDEMFKDITTKYGRN